MTLVDKLRAHAATQPDALAFEFLAESETVAASLTWAQLDARARAVGAELVARGLREQRVLLLYAPGLDFIVALLGCFYAGAVAVPAYPPEPARLARTLPRLQAIIADCRPTLVVTTSAFAMMAPHVAKLAPDLARVPWAASDEWALGATQAGTLTPPGVSELALIQYTSGSTATPKGVMVGHDNLCAHLLQLAMRRDESQRAHIVSWLPFYHDMGLICGILLPVFMGVGATLMSPISFLKKPLSWLRAMHRHRGWMGSAPPFALELCARKIRPDELAGMDFTPWKVLAIGAEPIRRQSLERFAQLLAPFGFDPQAICPAYGLAETVLAIALSPTDAPYVWGSFDAAALQQGHALRLDHGEERAQSSQARVLVGSGTLLAEEHVEIADPATHMPLEAGRVGEIWVAGPNVARGYFRRDAESAEVFGARLASPPGKTETDRSFLRTGDLGFLSEGELFVTGRIKDLIIVRGLNHYPQDIEHTVENAHPLVRPGGCAAFPIVSSQESEGERLAVAAEVDSRTFPEDSDSRRAILGEISAAIRFKVSRQHALRVHTLVLLKFGELPKTSSGKVMRRGCRDDLAAGRLAELDRSVAPGEDADEVRVENSPAVDVPLLDRSASGLVAWLRPWIARRLRVSVETLTATVPFAQFGLDSVEAVELSAELATALGQPLPETVFLEYPNVVLLAEHLSGQAVQPPPVTVGAHSCVVDLAVGGAQRPLILVPGIFGMLSAFSQLVTELGGLMPLWGLDLPVHHGQAMPKSIGALASDYVDELLAKPEAPSAEPFRIAGYCSGGMIAIEVARQLEERGRSVERVLLLDAPYLDGASFDLRKFLAGAGSLGAGLAASAPEDAIRQVLRHAAQKSWTVAQGPDFLDRMVTGGVANLTTFQHWQPRPISVATSLFSAAERVAVPLYETDASVTAARWANFLGRPPEHVDTPGNHHSMLQPPHVAELARVLVGELSRQHDLRS